MMKTYIRGLKGVALLLTFFFFQLSAATAQDMEAGKKIFETNCTACHKLGGKLIGPDLTGVKSRWSDESKLIAFVHNSQAVIGGGDAYAKALYAKYNVLMPPQDLTDEEVKDVLAYVDAGGMKAGPATADAGGATAGGGGGGYSQVPPANSFMEIIFYVIIVLLVAVLILSLGILKLLRKDDEEKKPKRLWVRANAFIFPVFLILFIGLSFWESGLHTDYYMPSQSASDVGEQIDKLFDWTLWTTLIVFIITQVLLFWYPFRYRHQDGKKGYFYPHNNTLEIIWTSIPAVVLAGLVLYGFQTWQKATSNPANNPITIEAFAKQFDWTFRYPGPDGKLGKVDFRKIDPASNPLGLDYSDPAAQDDYLVTELHLPVERDVYLALRSQDVIHAAYLPHFRMQMYAQPGMDTRIRFKPIRTTAQMRAEINKPEFNYELACNQLCGAAHFNMRRLIVVETDGEFNEWQKDKKPAYEKMKEAQATASK